MAKNIYVEGIDELPVPKRNVEIVERKGIGHPDSVSDGIAESVSRALCKMYVKEFGHVLHHNTDETQIAAGRAHPKFGGGTIIDPSYILLVGRATTEVEIEKELKYLPCKPVAIRAAREYLDKTFPNLDVSSEVIMDARIGLGSDDLTGVYKASGYHANDTSFGVGYAPFSITDRLTLETEEFINGPLKKKMPETGQDVKVMASRIGNEVTLTVACAMVDRYLSDEDAYMSAMVQLKDEVTDNALKIVGNEKINVNVDVNTGDDFARKVYYLTVTGMSQEMGDDGSVGRGNRCNGLITPYRPMSMEATSGKNPITHIGKIYNVMSKLVAEEISKEIGPEAEIRVRLLSQIGKPISQPLNASIQVLAPGADDPKEISRWKSDAEGIMEDWLDNIDKVTELITTGKVRTF
ncbi:MAG: methionine adenosyltransferase [Candidatus Methanomethylophilaceae archaeon]|jgi:S-adenosylmethionine synthetase|nr:methionine adenosyltransferase [Candidatus Methanomethylophilaceae archaeon]NCA73959.1 methionine adenosyltransferase [Gammaproteobacteria bacterium]MDD2936257.1 methionine adenosyltransferase [Candidatus Methanomethylophilaceae archaeon]MDD3351087.1 methionine adenosyltransferase [Candidatus Methanomethylophilaceae archaeon]MDD3986312.1 methionine adenosyltransferase [Candidatus Methanomethylophilaceae archaeon]